jgi:hypothetical protein
MNVVQTLNNRNNSRITKLYIPYVTCVLHLWQDNVRITYHRSAFVQPQLQWKSKSITYSECVSVTLIIQHAKSTCHIIFSSVASPALSHFFPHYFAHSTTFRKKVTEHDMGISIFLQLLSETFLILRSKKVKQSRYRPGVAQRVPGS